MTGLLDALNKLKRLGRKIVCSKEPDSGRLQPVKCISRVRRLTRFSFADDKQRKSRKPAPLLTFLSNALRQLNLRLPELLAASAAKDAAKELDADSTTGVERMDP